MSSEEVANAVRTLKLRKAKGVGEIQAERLTYGRHNAILYPCRLFKSIIKIGMILRELK